MSTGRAEIREIEETLGRRAAQRRAEPKAVQEIAQPLPTGVDGHGYSGGGDSGCTAERRPRTLASTGARVARGRARPGRRWRGARTPPGGRRAGRLAAREKMPTYARQE